LATSFQDKERLDDKESRDGASFSATIEILTDVAKHANPMGTVHGSVLCDVADAAIGTAHATGLGEGESEKASGR